MDAQKIGRKLVSLRAGARREAVAAAVGISVSALAMYETGRRVPRDELKVKLAKFYKSDVNTIFFADNVSESAAPPLQ